MSDRPELSRLLAALRDLVHWFDAARVRGVVIGGVAAALRGRPRTTRDIDTLVLHDPERWNELLESAEAHGFTSRIADPLPFARRSRMLLLRHLPSRIDIDVSLGGLPFEEELMARAEGIELGGITVPVASAEDLIIMKAVAHRPRDLADIESILEVAEGLEFGRIRRWVREFSSVLNMPEILEDLEKLLRRHPRPD